MEEIMDKLEVFSEKTQSCLSIAEVRVGSAVNLSDSVTMSWVDRNWSDRWGWSNGVVWADGWKNGGGK